MKNEYPWKNVRQMAGGGEDAQNHHLHTQQFWNIAMIILSIVAFITQYKVKPVMRDHCNERPTSDKRPLLE